MNWLVRWPRRYQRVISLGYFCDVARELQRYGLRDASYPFDWVVSDIRAVLTLLEADDDGLLRLENLNRDPARPHVVRDQSLGGLGVWFFNDFDADQGIEPQLPAVRAKYSRRMQRLRRSASRPTLFVRYVHDRDEQAFLEANIGRLLGILRGLNSKNDLVLIGSVGYAETSDGLEIHLVEPDPGEDVARQFLRKDARLHRMFQRLNYPLSRRIPNYLRYLVGKRRRWSERSRFALRRLLGEQRLRRLVRHLRGRGVDV